MSRAVGIDLGTTNSVLAYITGKNTPEVADNLDSEKWTPSLVFYDDSGEFIVGKSVRDMGQKDPERMVYSIKRFMGRDFDDPVLKNQIESQRFPYIIEKDEKGEILVRLGDRYFSPPEISAFILEGIKRYGEAYIEDEISHAVITVPAYFGTRQKEVTRQAGRLAGFNVLRVLPEPTAAALAYGLDADPEEPKTVLVYDLGGGTLDVTVMFIGGGTFMDQGKSGDMWLGGDDFDNCIVDDLVQMIQDQYRVDVRTLPNSKEIMLTLKYKAERAKIQLSNTTRTQIIIPGLIRSGGKIVTVEYEIDRTRFNDMIRPLVKRSIDIVYEGIKKANTTIEDIDTILMVGGSTRVPMVEDELHRIFPGKVARKKINPMLCVAQGAAIHTLMIDPAEFDSQPDPHIVECKECGTLNIKDRADCRKCGEIIGEGEIIRGPITPPRPTIECPECGVANTLGSTECKNCGYFFEKPGEGVMEKLSRPIGIELEGGALEIILSDDMFLPTDPVTTLLHTTKADQRRVVMPVYEGDKPIAKENQYLGMVEGPLPPGLPVRTDVNVTLRADIDGTLQVTAEVPSCPEVKIEAVINWKVKPINGGLIDETPTPPQPQTWENEAMVVLFMAAAVREEGKNLLPPHIYDPIMQLAEQLEQARRIGDERNGRRIMDQLRPLVENLIFVTVGLAKIIKQDPELPRKIGMEKAERLAQILNKLDQLRQAGRTDEYVQVYKAELEGFINEIIGLLTAKEGGNLGDLLQKASSSSSDWKT